MIQVKARMICRNALAVDWAAASPAPTLLAGELGIESDTGKWKIGDGVTPWNTLEYQDLGRPTHITTGVGTELELSDNYFYEIDNVSEITITEPSGDYNAYLLLSMDASATINVALPSTMLRKGNNIEVEATNNELWELSISNGRALILNWGVQS